jgi:hypothetical protein
MSEIVMVHLGEGQGVPLPADIAAIQWVKATGIGVAFLAATSIFLKSPAAAEGLTKVAKQRLLVLGAVLAAALVLGALQYFVPIR